MPVLAKQTVKRATLEKNRQVLEADFRTPAMGISGKAASCSARANPVGHAIGRQGIMIPGQFAAGGSNPHQMTILVAAQATVPGFIFWYAAAVHTDPARYTFGRIRRLDRQPGIQPALPVNPCGNIQRLLRPPANACQTDTQGFGNVWRAPLT
jgi:hypothetical protein